MSVIKTSDFATAPYLIPVNPNQTLDLQNFIDKEQEDRLLELFGVELYDLFIADLVADAPTSARFIKVFDSFYEQTGCNNTLIKSDGIKEMLKGFVYYAYLRQRVTRVDTTGISMVLSENNEPVSAIYHDITRRYNEAIETFKVIRYYMINVDASTYPEFKGVDKQFNHPY